MTSRQDCTIYTEHGRWYWRCWLCAGEIKECPADEVAFDAAEHYRIWHTDGRTS